MRALLLSRTAPAAERPLREVAREPPEPGEGEVAVAVEACGVCRTDVHLLEGEVPARLPIVPGHQAAGKIAALGAGIEAFTLGDAVGVGWMARVCGECRFCRSERENLCERALFTGCDRDGGYAERLVADARWVYRLPPKLSPLDAAPLLCAGVIGYRSLRLSGIRRGGRLGLFGFGASAHLALQVARHWGCEVYAFTRDEAHRELARSLGADWAGGPSEDPGVALDAAVTFAPAGEIVPAALARVDRGGVVAVNAIHMSPIPELDYPRLYGERVVRSVMNFTRRDALELLELAADVPIRARVETYELAQAGEALLRVRRGQVRGAAVLRIG